MKKLLLILSLVICFSCDSTSEIVTVKGLYQIEVPSGMTPNLDLNPNASLGYANLSYEKYLIVLDESKSEWIDVIIEMGMNDQDYMSEYVSFLSDQISDNFNTTYRLSDVYLNDSTSATLMEINVLYEETDTIWNTLFIEGKYNLYQISFWAPKERDGNIDELLNAAKTFKEL